MAKTRKISLAVFSVLLSVVLILSGAMIWKELSAQQKEKDDFDTLAELVELPPAEPIDETAFSTDETHEKAEVLRDLSALFSQNGVAGFIFYGYIILFLIGMFMPDMLPFNPGSKPLMILFIGVPVVLFFMKEPLNGLMKGEGLTPHQGWGNFVLEEVFEVLEIILSFVTNSLSYLRVGGFVLSHAGMMLVVMTLVKMTGNAGPVVFVLGNLFVMGLEGLIVGIQTLRLEYYEMFSRYFVGNGKKFTMISSENA